MKILAINFGGIGDEIFFLPTLISLKKEFPNAHITLALEPRSKSIKDLTDVIDDMFFADIKRKNKYIELMKLICFTWTKNFDIIIASGGNKFISILLSAMKAKKRYGYDTGKLSQILLTKTVKLNKNQYACNMYHDLITPITNHKTLLPEINVSPQDKIENSILIHPGVSKMSIEKGMTKTIPADTWAEIVDLLQEKGKKVILAGGPDDNEVIETIRNKTKLKDFEDYYGKTKSLKDLAVLIGKAEKFICSDSAPLHVGVAMHTKTYAIFGPTDDKKLIPQSDDVIAIKANDKCPIKPCLWEHRQTTCENLDCLKMTAEEIVNKVL